VKNDKVVGLGPVDLISGRHLADRLIGTMSRGGGRMARPLRRVEAKELTRRRLVRAAMQILDERGEAGLSASAVSRVAGIAQSSFYGHFRGREDLLSALGDEAVLHMRRVLRDARQRSREEPTDLERMRATFRLPLESVAAHPALFRLGLRTRHEPASPIGEATRELLVGYRRDLYDDLMMLGYAGTSPGERRRVEMIADGYIALTEALATGHVEGRYPNLDEIVDVLMVFTIGPRSLLPD
jgi:TetR/AcrR family transcriptional regulator, fatty acid biosynthesis regulator